MNGPLRRVAIAMFVLFGMLFVNLNYWQFVRGDDLRYDDRNGRTLTEAYKNQRGYILVDDEFVATSVETDGELRWQREYPTGPLYAHATGYDSVQFGDAGVESSEDALLSGRSGELFARRVGNILTGRQQVGGTVVLTLEREAQQAAAEAIGDRKGSVLALDPRDGSILAMVSRPTYDPNLVSTNALGTAADNWNALSDDPDEPFLNRAAQQIYPPGSTFKVVVAAAALEAGATPDTEVEGGAQFIPSGTQTPVNNFTRGEACDDGTPTLERALTISCNTSFAKLAVDLGEETLTDKAADFGFGAEGLPLGAAECTVGDVSEDALRAQAGIGQRDVRMSALQGAMIAAAVANDGRLMLPYLVRETQSPTDFSVLETTRPRELRQSVSPEVAGQLQQMMVSVVENGTGRPARLDGVTVGGKTGTAQDGDRPDHTWFIGYAEVEGEPVGAVAVQLENTGRTSSEATEIAGEVLAAIVAREGNP